MYAQTKGGEFALFRNLILFICPDSLKESVVYKGVGWNPSKGKIFYTYLSEEERNHVPGQDIEVQRLWQ